MLADFVTSNRIAIIEGARARVAARTYPIPSQVELSHGIPVFLDQLVDALHLAESSGVIAHEEIAKTAGLHGHDLFRMGLSIAQVVHDYGDVCQTVTELATRQNARIPGDEFQTLNLCLDDAIAGAVTEYARQRERTIVDEGAERLGILAHELRNLLNSAMLSFDSIKRGRVSLGGSTALIHGRSLLGLRDLIDRSLAEVRLDAGVEHVERISVAEFIEEIEIGAVLQAQARGLHLAVIAVDRALTIEGDRPLLVATVSNLLQNAFKFTTRKDGHVSLTTRATADRVYFDIEDECGGLPPGKAEDLFRPFEQRGSDRRGLGLGLAICLRAAKANGGELHVRDLPGKGCVFTLDLPRKPPPPLALVSGGKAAEQSASASPPAASGAGGSSPMARRVR
ncbi:MAG TPA: HAMP domain-containing sensor histidine kinase [Polyangiaceae bacterium]|nr:HAMP domain-containing sensor histidine kinase [Polyangiaceae bacterium]